MINLRTLDGGRLTRLQRGSISSGSNHRKRKKNSRKSISESEYSDSSFKEDEISSIDPNREPIPSFDEIRFLQHLNDSNKAELLRTSSSEEENADEPILPGTNAAHTIRLRNLGQGIDSDSSATIIDFSNQSNPNNQAPVKYKEDDSKVISLLTTDDESICFVQSTPKPKPTIKLESRKRSYESESTEDGNEINFPQSKRTKQHFRTQEEIDYDKRQLKTLDQMIREYDNGEYRFQNSRSPPRDSLDLSSKQYGQVVAQLSKSSSELSFKIDNTEKEERQNRIKAHLDEIRAANKMPACRTKFHNREEQRRVNRLGIKESKLQKVIKKMKSKDKNFDPEKELILDYDSKEKNLIKVDRRLVDVLKDHQKDGVKFMYDCCFGNMNQIDKFSGSGCILAHCMGLGKTLQIITLIDTLISHESLQTKKILVLGPKSTVLNWTDEIAHWLGPQSILEVFVIGENAKILDKLKVLDSWGKAAERKAGILILGYEAFRHLIFYKTYKKKDAQCSESALLDIQKRIDTHFQSPGPDLVICDEGHIIKNRKSKIWAAASTISTPRRIVLTGTPMQNNLNECKYKHYFSTVIWRKLRLAYK